MTPDTLVNDTKQLLSLPKVLLKANELLNSDRSDADDLGTLVSHDPALAAQVLRLANSASYRRSRAVDSLSQATTVLGTDGLRNLIYASKSAEIFDGISSDLIDMTSFFHRSIYVAALAKRLAVSCKMGRGDDQYLSGLFNDIGKLVLYSQQPVLAEEILRQSEISKTPIPEVEKAKLSFTSAAVSAALLRQWHLPETIWGPIAQLHCRSLTKMKAETMLLRLAINITDSIEPELKNTIPPEQVALPTDLLAYFDLDEVEIGVAVMAANSECDDVLAIINQQGPMFC
ncbi:HDOD domain-containing protein [Neiella sp. HB171785]|uniref:HDOD domain-containing protein n=1 Tax=Neiella litorisoli TaxID=2771431 RepID=A0A8J6QGR8_9GAMM|nr:HDOD domain-containing protein [Neiella litorisoli]MBD1388043.1 HDOD domain-containing protein [Neiella litorisoli]